MQTQLTILFLIVTKTVAHVCVYNSSVELTNRTYNGVKYEDGEYFVDKTTGVERGCVCMKETCIRKCCPFGQIYDMGKIACVDSPEDATFNPPVQNGFNAEAVFIPSKEFHFLIYRMNCSKDKDEHRLAMSQLNQRYHIKRDGKLYAIGEESIAQNVYGPDKYCVDNFINSKKNISKRFEALVCYYVKQEENHYLLNAICMFISCFFIILTVVVYACLPELRNLPGFVMIAYLLSFFVTFVFLAVMQILLLIDNITRSTCTGMTFVIYFSMLAGFFWLNVMCYDLWAKFRIKNMAHGFKESTRVRFLKYCAYGFGVPAALTVLLAALEYVDLPYSQYRPNLRLQGCFIYGKSKQLYLYTPIVLICIANLVLFILTAKKLATAQKESKVLNKKDTQRLWLYIKLFAVTGTNWIMEVISDCFPKIPYVWQITDVYNILVGLLIFIIFVCKKSIWMSIKKMFVKN